MMLCIPDDKIEQFLDELADASPDPCVGIYLDEGTKVLEKYKVHNPLKPTTPSYEQKDKSEWSGVCC